MFQRGQSCGGGYSSLGYLFGGEDKPRVRPNNRPTQQCSHHDQPVNEQENLGGYGRNESPYSLSHSATPPTPPENERPAAGKVFHDQRGTYQNNNYHRADGQNSGNFITDRPSTRVQATPGGQSSLGYLFG